VLAGRHGWHHHRRTPDRLAIQNTLAPVGRESTASAPVARPVVGVPAAALEPPWHFELVAVPAFAPSRRSPTAMGATSR
jgi:hypothetical protein